MFREMFSPCVLNSRVMSLLVRSDCGPFAFLRTRRKVNVHLTHTAQNSRKNRQRNIIWFNPPYSMNIQTNIGREFLNLVDKHFPKNHRYNKIFNKNNIKVSYSCTDNLQTIIKKHNRKILETSKKPSTENNCNCKKKKTTAR